MLCELHSVYEIIHRGSQIIIHYTVKGQFFAFNLEKNYTGQKKFTQAPLVVLVTNMRYGSWYVMPSVYAVSTREGNLYFCSKEKLAVGGDCNYLLHLVQHKSDFKIL